MFLARISHQRVPLLDVRQAVLGGSGGTASCEAVAHCRRPYPVGEKCGLRAAAGMSGRCERAIAGRQGNYNNPRMKQRVAACLPFGKTRYFYPGGRAISNWKPYCPNYSIKQRHVMYLPYRATCCFEGSLFRRRSHTG